MTASSGEQRTNIAINGANGFIGSHIVKELSDRGCTPVCIVREGESAEDIALLESVGAKVVLVNTDVRDDSLIEAMQGCDTLIHLIGSIAPPKGTSLETLQTDLARHFFESAQKAGVQKSIVISALGSGPDAKSEYNRTKWLAEEEVKKLGLTYVIIRPSFTIGRSFGHRDSKLLRRYLTMIETKKMVPLVLGGKNKVQPIYVGDLAKAFAQVTLETTWDNSVLEVAGKDATTTRGFVEALMDTVGIHKPFASIPEPIAWCVAYLCEVFQQVPTLSRDQLKISKQDSVANPNDLEGKLGIQPTSLKDSLAFYGLERQAEKVVA